MSQKTKGSQVKIGDRVTIEIKKKDMLVVAIAQGEVSGIRKWDVDVIAVEIEGIDEWFILNDFREIRIH